MKAYQHNTGIFIGKGANEIFFQKWEAVSPKIKLLIIHGMGEHSGRYENIISKLSGKGISIYALDNRGNGKSAGKRGHVDSFMDYVYDLKIYMDFIQHDNPAIPVIMMGHSLGAVIAQKYALEYPDDISALILSSTALIPAFQIPSWKVAMATFLTKQVPALTNPTNLDPVSISRDPEVVKKYMEDPLVHDRASVRFYTEVVAAQKECLDRARELKIPLLVLHGTGDLIVDFRGSQMVFNAASSKNKEMHLFEGFYHETMNDTGKEQVLTMISAWITKTGANKKKAPAASKKNVPVKKKPAVSKKAKTGKVAKAPKKKTPPKSAKKVKRK